MVECNDMSTVISVHKQGEGRMEFHGADHRWWGVHCANESFVDAHFVPHNKRTYIDWACWLFNGLEGWHACILFTDDEFCIHPDHPDYEHVASLWVLGQLTDAEVLDFRGVL
jgi:hypothetical protein